MFDSSFLQSILLSYAPQSKNMKKTATTRNCLETDGLMGYNTKVCKTAGNIIICIRKKDEINHECINRKKKPSGRP